MLHDVDGRPLDIPEEYINQIRDTIAKAWTQSTLETYAAGLLAFHVFCDKHGIPEDQRAPASTDLVAAWITTMAGHYAGTSVSNYLNGVRAWHLIHGVEWQMKDNELEALIRSTVKRQPIDSQPEKREPYTVDYISKILNDFDLNDPFDAACASCLTTTFYAVGRLGEFTVRNLTAFSSSEHITPANVREETDRNGFKTTIFHVPKTKSDQKNGEDLYWSKQTGPTDPKQLFDNHMCINKPAASQPLFAYRFTQSNGKTIMKPLTKTALLQRIKKGAESQSLKVLQGHGIRIGGTLEYLLRGVPFDSVKVIGRWKSDAFLIYLRKHAEIMAPYMQPELHQQLIQYSMPPVRCEFTPTLWVSTVAGCVVTLLLSMGITADRVCRKVPVGARRFHLRPPLCPLSLSRALVSLLKKIYIFSSSLSFRI